VSRDPAVRLVTHPRFRWAPDGIGRAYGMLTVRGNRNLWAHDPAEQPFLRCSPFDEVREFAVPDLTDFATQGVLLSWLDEAEFNPHVHLSCASKADLSDAYEVMLRDLRRFTGPSLGHALALALLDVWGDP
jgi:hypothetical protein